MFDGKAGANRLVSVARWDEYKAVAQFPEMKGKVAYGDDFFQYQGP